MSQHASLRERAATRTMKTYGKTALLGVALASLAFALILVLTIGVQDVQANPVARRSPSAHGGNMAGGMLQQSSDNYNNLDNLISEFLDDRIKKTKQNSVRQIKQTLRFGRRSDPLMMPLSELERSEGDLSDRFSGRPASQEYED